MDKRLKELIYEKLHDVKGYNVTAIQHDGDIIRIHMFSMFDRSYTIDFDDKNNVLFVWRGKIVGEMDGYQRDFLLHSGWFCLAMNRDGDCIDMKLLKLCYEGIEAAVKSK